jgi:hypothetical protein
VKEPPSKAREAIQNQTLTVNHDLFDADGQGMVAYQWQSSMDGAQCTDVAGGNGSFPRLHHFEKHG